MNEGVCFNCDRVERVSGPIKFKLQCVSCRRHFHWGTKIIFANECTYLVLIILTTACLVPRMPQSELAGLIQASTDGRKHVGLESWRCKRCSKKPATNDQQHSSRAQMVAGKLQAPTNVIDLVDSDDELQAAPSEPMPSGECRSCRCVGCD